MPEWAEKVITWDDAKQYIEEGTVESLGRLRRSEEQLRTYRAFMDKVRQEYASVGDFIKISVLDCTSRVNPEGKKEAVDAEHTGHQLVWHKNDFPYYYEPDVTHWLLWSTGGPLDHPTIQQHIQDKFPQQDWEHLMFVNPAALQSILSIWHCHILVRPRRNAAAAAMPN